MRYLLNLCLFCLIVPAIALAQKAPPPPPPPPAPPQAAAPSPPPPPGGLGKWWKNSSAVRDLELSPAQVEQIESAFLQHQPRLSQLRAELLQSEQQLKAALQSEQLNEGVIRAQSQAIGQLRLVLENENSEMTLKMRRVMTAEQWRRLDRIWAMVSAGPPPPPPPPPPSVPKYDSADAGVKYAFKTDTPGVQAPELITRTLPAYTPEARKAKISGVVVLDVIIGKDGSVGAVKVIRGLGYGLDESAVRAVQQWRFRPGMLNNQMVPVHANIELSFRLE